MLMNGTIYALKVGGVEQEVFRSIQQGEGRFGWSYIENADLHYLRDKWQKAVGTACPPMNRHAIRVFCSTSNRMIMWCSSMYRKRSRGDHGADIIVTFESGLPVAGLGDQQTCIVQVKPFEGEHWSKDAIEQIEQAFAYYRALNPAMGLIISTANKAAPEFERELEAASVRLKNPSD